MMMPVTRSLLGFFTIIENIKQAKSVCNPCSFGEVFCVLAMAESAREKGLLALE